MSEIPYKGYLIRPTPLQLRDSGEWTIEIYISKHRGNSVTERNYSAGNKFKTEEEAIQYCINYGKQIIDGDSENCTVTDL